MAAFFLADFSVGFFLAAAGFFAALLGVDFWAGRATPFATFFFPALAALRAVALFFAAGFLRATFFFTEARLAAFPPFFTAFVAAFFLPLRFLAFAMLCLLS
ncbi:MAG: hypothetical protein ACM3SS_23405 [Rhodospirillaceae bacterium]